MEYKLKDCVLTCQKGNSSINKAEVERFKKLYKLTDESIKMDINMAREDPGFAVIIAPWFPVKCYYALYYLETILLHLIDGDLTGFQKGGHSAIRRKICLHTDTQKIKFSEPVLNDSLMLSVILDMPSITSGKNTQARFWADPDCLRSVAKKLLDYKMLDSGIKKLDLRNKINKQKYQEYITNHKLMIIDFFYWFRIKANYRDLDFIDFEKGITDNETLNYIDSYFNAYDLYRVQLTTQIKQLLLQR